MMRQSVIDAVRSELLQKRQFIRMRRTEVARLTKDLADARQRLIDVESEVSELVEFMEEYAPGDKLVFGEKEAEKGNG